MAVRTPGGARRGEIFLLRFGSEIELCSSDSALGGLEMGKTPLSSAMHFMNVAYSYSCTVSALSVWFAESCASQLSVELDLLPSSLSDNLKVLLRVVPSI